jgi:predicted ATP-binding protein involved in virulence
MELTKEYFDEQMSKLVKKSEFEEQAVKVNEDLSFLKAKTTSIEEKVARVDRRDKEDSDAFAKDILHLQKDVKALKLKHAI